MTRERLAWWNGFMTGAAVISFILLALLEWLVRQ